MSNNEAVALNERIQLTKHNQIEQDYSCSLCGYILDLNGNKTCNTCKINLCAHCTINSDQCRQCDGGYYCFPQTDQIIENLRHLKLKCPFVSEGCHDEMEYETMANHIDLCFYKQFNCGNCGKSFIKESYENHILLCHNRIVICDCGIRRENGTNPNHICEENHIKKIIRPFNIMTKCQIIVNLIDDVESELNKMREAQREDCLRDMNSFFKKVQDIKVKIFGYEYYIDKKIEVEEQEKLYFKDRDLDEFKHEISPYEDQQDNNTLLGDTYDYSLPVYI